MKVRCTAGRYVNPQFDLSPGEESPELTIEEAERIARDFPETVEIVTDARYEHRMVTTDMMQTPKVSVKNKSGYKKGKGKKK